MEDLYDVMDLDGFDMEALSINIVIKVQTNPFSEPFNFDNTYCLLKLITKDSKRR